MFPSHIRRKRATPHDSLTGTGPRIFPKMVAPRFLTPQSTEDVVAAANMMISDESKSIPSVAYALHRSTFAALRPPHSTGLHHFLLPGTTIALYLPFRCPAHQGRIQDTVQMFEADITLQLTTIRFFDTRVTLSAAAGGRRSMELHMLQCRDIHDNIGVLPVSHYLMPTPFSDERQPVGHLRVVALRLFASFLLYRPNHQSYGPRSRYFRSATPS